MGTLRDWDRGKGRGNGFGGTDMEKTREYIINRGNRQEAEILDKRASTRHYKD